MADDFVLRLSERANAFAFLDRPARVEVFALASFGCCLLGSLVDAFPLAANLAVAQLALLASRSRSEAQLIALCGFVLFTAVTDVIFMCVSPSGWGGMMIILNIVLKLSYATQAYRLCYTLSHFAGYGDEPLPTSDAGPASGAYPPAYQAPPPVDGDADAGDSLMPGEATRYRAI